MRYDVRKVIRMLYRLQRHGLPIKAHFRSSLVLAYAVPALLLRLLLPTGLILDTYGDFGFPAIALVHTGDLRPAFVPDQLEMSFLLSGYRIFTRLSNNRRADAVGSTHTPKRHEPDVDAALWKSSNPLPLRALALHPTENRFNEAEFLAELPVHGCGLGTASICRWERCR